MRKPYRTPEHHHVGIKALKEKMLGIIIPGVLSGRRTRKRVYQETI
jgi:hypothetical protein